MHFPINIKTPLKLLCPILMILISGSWQEIYAQKNTNKSKKTNTQTKSKKITNPSTISLNESLDQLSKGQPTPQRRKLIELGETLLGKPYKSRGVAAWPLDCSGYVAYLYKSIGLNIPRSSSAQSQIVERVDKPQKGDLVFFKGRNASSNRVGHVAIVVDNVDEDLIIMHSTNSRGVIKHRLSSSAYFNKRFLFSGRIRELAPNTHQTSAPELSPSPEINLPQHLLQPNSIQMLIERDRSISTPYYSITPSRDKQL